MHRLDVFPDGTVKVAAAAAASRHVSLDGVSFSIKAANSGDWKLLNETLPAALQPQYGVPDDGWQVPGYTQEGRRVYLRGVFQNLTGNFQEGALLGTLPTRLAPKFAHSFAVIGHSTIDT